MLKNELIAKTENKKMNWPADCIWPEPVKDGEGSYWEAEDAEALPLDTEGEYFLEIKEYMRTPHREIGPTGEIERRFRWN